MFLNDTDNSGEPELLEREKQSQEHKIRGTFNSGYKGQQILFDR